VFLPGRHGRELRQAIPPGGLADKIKFLSAFTVDESTLPAQQDAALGFFRRRELGAEPRQSAEQGFRRGYEKEYNAVPATYAFQAYDAAC
jgi:branched-chain amino acid transport system substrate-binding protein